MSVIQITINTDSQAFRSNSPAGHGGVGVAREIKRLLARVVNEFSTDLAEPSAEGWRRLEEEKGEMNVEVYG